MCAACSTTAMYVTPTVDVIPETSDFLVTSENLKAIQGEWD